MYASYSLNYTYAFYLYFVFDILHDKQFLSAVTLGMWKTEGRLQLIKQLITTCKHFFFSSHFSEIRAWNHTRCVTYVIYARKTSDERGSSKLSDHKKRDRTEDFSWKTDRHEDDKRRRSGDQLTWVVLLELGTVWSN